MLPRTRQRSRRRWPPQSRPTRGERPHSEGCRRYRRQARRSSGGKRRIAHKAANHIPRQAEHRRHRKRCARLQQIVVGGKSERDHRSDDQQDQRGAHDRDRHVRRHSKPFRPTRPEGRTTRTRIMSANPTVVLHCAPKTTAPKLSSNPSARPPTRAPGHAAEAAEYADHEGFAEKNAAQ